MRRIFMFFIVALFACGRGDTTGPAEVQPEAEPLPLKSISIYGPGLVQRGTAVQLVALVFDVSNARVQNPQVTWSSSKPDVATINEQGWVTGLTEGSTTISVITHGKNGTFEIQSGLTVVRGSADCNRNWYTDCDA